MGASPTRRREALLLAAPWAITAVWAGFCPSHPVCHLPQAREGTCGDSGFDLKPGEPIMFSSVDAETYCALFLETRTEQSLFCL